MNKPILTIALAIALLAGCDKPPLAPEVPPPAGNATAQGPDKPEPALVAAQTPSIPKVDEQAHVDQAIDHMLGDHVSYRKVMADLQAAVVAKDAAGVAVLVDYPIGVDINGKRTVIKDAQAFVQKYDQFMTPEMAKAIVDSRYATVMVNAKGMMLGQGEAWINGVCKDAACKDMQVKLVALQPAPGE